MDMPGGDKPQGKKKSNYEQGQAAMDTVTEKYLGPSYDYSKQIKLPSEMGMSAAGNFDTLAKDVGGLISYVNVLITGTGEASRTGEPLGTKFFLETVMNCKDVESGDDVKRSIYVNNVPDGTIPFVSEAMGNTSFDEFKGLLPGVLSNIAQIKPIQLIKAFVNGGTTYCQQITMQTIGSDNTKGTASAYVSNTDIDDMNPAWFVVPGFTSKPDTTQPEESEDSFTTIKANTASSSLFDSSTLKGSNIDFGAMPDDFFIKIYLSSLGLLGLYIFLKIMLKKRMK
jgi:hypothetical protein